MKRSIAGLVGGVLLVSVVLYACSSVEMSSSGEDALLHEMMPAGALGDIAFYRSGSDGGQRVIFVHGTPGDALAWRSYLDDVPDGHDYIAVDRPGFGNSVPGTVVPGLLEQAAAIEPWLPKDGTKAILVGHSLGGPIIAKAAVLYPERVGALVIVAGSLDPGMEKINPLQYLGRWWPISRLLPSSLYNSNLEIFALEAELIVLEPELSRVTLPVIIIHGTKDRLVPYENVAFMEKAFTNAILDIVTLDGKNHFLPWNSKPVVDDAIASVSLVLNE